MWMMLWLGCDPATPPAPAATPPPVAPLPAVTPAPVPASATPAPVPPASATPAQPLETPKVNTLLGEADGITFLGNWTSPKCGGRKYPRNIRFEEDNTWAGIDLITPCPVGTTCVWSGMVGYTGLWVMGDKKVLLQEMGSAGGPGSPHPTEFIADREGHIIEHGCLYTRGLHMPPGYTEEQVTPRAPKPPVVAP